MSKVIEEYIKSYPEIDAKGDIDSITFQNMLSIKMAIDYLFDKGSITKDDLQILNGVAYGYTWEDLSNILCISRATLAKRFSQICRIISYILGGDFTDLGFLRANEREVINRENLDFLED